MISWNIIGSPTFYEPISQFNPSTELTVTANNTNVISLRQIVSGLNPAQFVAGDVNVIASEPFPVNIGGTISIVALNTVDIHTRVVSQFGWEFVAWMQNPNQWTTANSTAKGSDIISYFGQVSTINPEPTFYFAFESMQRFYSSAHDPIQVNVDYALEIYTNLDDQTDKWVIDFIQGERYIDNWTSNLPQMPFKYSNTLPLPTLTWGSKVIVGRWKTHDYQLTYNPATSIFFVPNGLTTQDGGHFGTLGQNVQAYPVEGGVSCSSNGVNFYNSSGSLEYFRYHTDDDKRSNAFFVVPTGLTTPQLDAYESTIGNACRLQVLNYQQLLYVNSVLVRTDSGVLITDEIYTTRTESLQLSLIGNAFPVVYLKYPPLSFVIDSGTVTILPPQDFADRLYSLVDQSGLPIRMSSDPFLISELQTPYPTKIGWADQYGVISELTDIIIPNTNQRYSVIVTTTYNKTTKLVTISPNITLPNDTFVMFMGMPTVRLGNTFTVTTENVLSNGVYIPSVVIPSSDNYNFSYNGLFISDGQGQDQLHEGEEFILIAIIAITICFAAGIVALAK